MTGSQRSTPQLDLTDPRLVAIATAHQSLRQAGRPTDPASILSALQVTVGFPWARSAEVGVFLAELTGVDACPVPAQAVWHAQTVRAATVRRRLAAAGQRLQDWAAGDLDPELLADRVTAELLEVVGAIHRVSRPVAVSA